MAQDNKQCSDVVEALQEEFSLKADEIIQAGEMVVAANMMFAHYKALICAGFTRREAMELLKVLVTNSTNQGRANQ